MKRWHSVAERRLMLRRWRYEIGVHEDWGWHYPAPLPPDPDGDCHCYRGPGYFRKRRPFGCPSGKCMCKWDKLFSPPRAAAIRRAIQDQQ
jgi:hypothetical protein